MARATISGEERVFSLVLALVASPNGLTKRELLSSVHGYSDRFRPGEPMEALERQFERDKVQLRSLGVPLETIDSPLEPGNTQLTRYRISKTQLQIPRDLRFTERELMLLHLAALAWSEGSLSAPSRRATMRLEAMGAGLDVQHLGVALRVTPPEPSAVVLQQAIADRACVEFPYRLPSRHASLSRRVAPLRLHHADGRWHLIAFDLEREAPRVFLLARIDGPVKALRTTYDPELSELAEPQVAELLRRESTQRATLAVRRGTVAESRLAPRDRIAQSNEPTNDSWRRMSIGTLDYREHALADELIGYGSDVEVLDPADLREAMVSRWEAIAAAHTPMRVDAGPPAGGPIAIGGDRARRPDVAEQVLLLLTLVPFLEEHGPTPIVELADRFGVQPSVLRRLFEFLGTAGVPGETQTYQHEDLFDIDWDALERDDVASLVRPVAIDDVPRFAPAETAALLAGLHLVTPLLGADDAALARDTARKLGAALEIDEARMPLAVSEDPQDPRLPVLVGAILDRDDLTFPYRDADGNASVRRVSPIRLDQAARAWYLRAYCYDREDQRTFRLDRMGTVTVTDRQAALEGGRPAPREHAVARPDVGGMRVVARVLEKDLAAFSGFAFESLDRVTEPSGESDENDSEWIRIAVELHSEAATVTLVQRAPGSIVIEAPESAVAAIRSWAEVALSQYESAGRAGSLG